MEQPSCVDNFIEYFENLNRSDVSLTQMYDEGVEFQDPIHKLSSRLELETYFEKLNANVSSGGFEFHTVTVSGTRCVLEWTMRAQLRKPRKSVASHGVSVLIFDDKITHQRDYFDVGELVYEQIPIVGWLIKMIKRAL